MPYEKNVQTQNGLSAEIKTVRSRCAEAINIIENAPPENAVPPEDVLKESLSYVERLRTEIQDSNTTIETNDNILTSQFLTDIKKRTTEVEELAAYTKGAIHDVDAEINRLSEQIKVLKEVRSRPPPQKKQIGLEQLEKSKERFHLMKTELHSLMSSLFPDKIQPMHEIMSILISKRMQEPTDCYIEVTPETYTLVQLLKEHKIVSVNPYNSTQVKLAF